MGVENISNDLEDDILQRLIAFVEAMKE